MIKPSDLKKQAQQMIQDGTMPTLEELLQAVSDIRSKYKPQIENAQNQASTADAGASALGKS